MAQLEAVVFISIIWHWCWVLLILLFVPPCIASCRSCLEKRICILIAVARHRSCNFVKVIAQGHNYPSRSSETVAAIFVIIILVVVILGPLVIVEVRICHSRLTSRIWRQVAKTQTTVHFKPSCAAISLHLLSTLVQVLSVKLGDKRDVSLINLLLLF